MLLALCLPRRREVAPGYSPQYLALGRPFHRLRRRKGGTVWNQKGNNWKGRWWFSMNFPWKWRLKQNHAGSYNQLGEQWEFWWRRYQLVIWMGEDGSPTSPCLVSQNEDWIWAMNNGLGGKSGKMAQEIGYQLTQRRWSIDLILIGKPIPKWGYQQSNVIERSELSQPKYCTHFQSWDQNGRSGEGIAHLKQYETIKHMINISNDCVRKTMAWS